MIKQNILTKHMVSCAYYTISTEQHIKFFPKVSDELTSLNLVINF